MKPNWSIDLSVSTLVLSCSVFSFLSGFQAADMVETYRVKSGHYVSTFVFVILAIAALMCGVAAIRAAATNRDLKW